MHMKFSRGYVICEDVITVMCNKMCETLLKIQLSSIKPDPRGICKNGKCHSFHRILGKNIFTKILMLQCNRFIIVMFM